MSIYTDAYAKHKNLKLAADELNIPLPTLYWNLKKEGIVVTGDKSKYGSIKDKFGAKAEYFFSTLFPNAINNNKNEFQPKIDFNYGGLSIDVKGANRVKPSKKFNHERWAFSFKKQESLCDLFFCIGFNNNNIEKIFVIPCDLVRFYQSISISANGSSKWNDYAMSEHEAKNLIDDMATNN